MNRAAVWSLLNECTKLFVLKERSPEDLAAFIEERNCMMLTATGFRYYAWYLA